MFVAVSVIISIC